MRFERYDRIVSHYASMWPLLVPGYTSILQTMGQIVGVLPQRPQTVLDVGCGPGSAVAAVAGGCAASADVTLVDGSVRMLSAARRALGNHAKRVVHGDFCDPAVAANVFAPDHYDLIIVSFALHHLDDRAKSAVIGQVARALRPGGLVLLGDEVRADRPAGWDMVERIRSQTIREHLQAKRITEAFWHIETSLPAQMALPFLPASLSDLQTWMTQHGLAVGCPLAFLGTVLLAGIRATIA